jgi:hypothetical protein
MRSTTPLRRRSDPEFEWDDFATGDFESGEDEDV